MRDGWVGGLKIHFFALLSLQSGCVGEKSEILHYYSLLKKIESAVLKKVSSFDLFLHYY